MTDKLWVAGAGDWFAGGNWSPVGPPAPGDVLSIASGAPSIADADITGETIRLLGPVTLTARASTFAAGSAGPMIIAVRGDDTAPATATLAAQGTVSFLGKILVEAAGGGSLTIGVADAAKPGNFVIEENGFALVTQESLLTFTGTRVTNNGLIQVEGSAVIEAGLDFVGTGIVEIDNGGWLEVGGAMGAAQKLFLADGTGSVGIADLESFEARVGLGVEGGNRFRLEGITVRSASYDSGELTLYRHKHQKGAIEGELSVKLINPASLTFQPQSEQDLSARDFKFAPDNAGGTVMTYLPRGPSYLEASLPVPIVAETGTTIPLGSMLKQAFGTRDPGFKGITLLPAKALEASSDYWGQVAVNGIDPVLSGWIVNGKAITARTKVHKGDVVTFLVGNNIAFPPELRVQLTDATKGRKAEFLDYSIWTVDPAVSDLVHASDYVVGKPQPGNVVTSAESYQDAYGRVFNTELCNWIADNVAAAAGAPMPLPNQFLEPETNVEGGFWRIAYRGSDSDNPVIDWNTLVRPGDIVRLEWQTTGAGHTTTVLAVAPDGTLEVYDNIDVIDHEHHIGTHDDVAYWKKTDPAGITIYRLDPDGQYLIEGRSLPEHLRGSVFDDLVHARRGADVVAGGPGNDELRGGHGRDRLFGGPGDDVLIGGRLGDKLSGGAGANTFTYEAIRQSRPETPLRDTIKGFASGTDRIDLSVIDAKLAAAGQKPFHFVGEQPLTGHRGQLAYTDAGKYLLVEGDRDGDGRADFAIKVLGASQLTSDDFLL
ncbi:MAG: M10 family metallopeptidase C-terminal domain-containing protein [Bauldia sp.]|nr:M10 family metallopeptidase C-terminal domain-containing protein [Bauldia sp.]